MSECVVCDFPSLVIAVHSQSLEVPSCPENWVSLWTGYSFLMHLDAAAEGFWPVPDLAGVLSRELPRDALHRVHRPRHLQLLQHGALLLAGHRRPRGAVPEASAGHAQGRRSEEPGESVQRVSVEEQLRSAVVCAAVPFVAARVSAVAAPASQRGAAAAPAGGRGDGPGGGGAVRPPPPAAGRTLPSGALSRTLLLAVFPAESCLSLPSARWPAPELNTPPAPPRSGGLTRRARREEQGEKNNNNVLRCFVCLMRNY
ncbi:putative collagen alpha-1(IV) chain [Penaeus vannamei]|uniref:Putative collagen alpha-1(IV) chain n=1 Tax=Penaeus vannamei TaxID=6689 RepID=A0A3R7PMI5_PENVA|nr:putative collagen alpha-1(IV) chain [Penaeus vannamei]